MPAFENRKEKEGFACKLWRGERMTLIGFDVEDPEPDLAGFSIEVKGPGETEFTPLRNRLAFAGGGEATGDRKFDSTEAPFQKFRWVHFPWLSKEGVYRYRVAKQHMPKDGRLLRGIKLELDIEQRGVTLEGFVDVGFTRNFGSSQAFREMFGDGTDVLPAKAAEGLDFKRSKLKSQGGESVYDWLGFEAKAHLLGFLDEAIADPAVTLDAFAYDLNEPEVVGRLERLGRRLRIVIDDSEPEHSEDHSAESISAARLKEKGAKVLRTHFLGLQHHKVLIARRGGAAERVLCGSTNFTFRGLYVQANNILVFHAPEVADLFGRMFDLVFADPGAFKRSSFAAAWHEVALPGKPKVRVCFSPHKSAALPLDPVRDAIDGATSSVFYSIAFLGQTKSGPTYDAVTRLPERSVFSYGTAQSTGKLEVRKPDGSVGLVDFAFLSKTAPEPFKSEWAAGQGINIHHKFVVTDFSLPTAKVFTGSSNLSPSGETKNSDHLVVIEDRKVAAAYAIEACRVFDHLQFRNRMRDAQKPKKGPRPAMALQKPKAISGAAWSWFDRFYADGNQARLDRELFSR